MKFTNWTILAIVILNLSFTGCTIGEDEVGINILREALPTVECNNNHLLPEELDVAIPFQVLVRDLTAQPQSGIFLAVRFFQHQCDGESFKVYTEELVTDENGIVQGAAPYSFKWENSTGEWNIEVLIPNSTIAGHKETFTIDETFLYHIVTIAKLED